MPLVFQYLLKLSISLTILYLFYYVVLRRLTFYTYNRWYLLGYAVLSFFIAAIDITPFVSNNTPATFTWLRHFPTVQQFSTAPVTTDMVTETVTPAAWQLWDYAICIFITGILFLIIRLTIQVLSFRKIKRRATFIPSGDIHVYQVNAPIIPFSFGKNIYINSSLHAPQELEKIIQHEFVHVKQRHTVDIIISEVICFLNWYNPFAWLIRKAVRQNLEYIADDSVLRNGINKKEYQYLLLKVMGNQKFSIATPFNFSSLKKRIAMMNKLKTSKVHVLKFLFLLPLMATVLLAFRSGLSENKTNTSFTYGGVVINQETGQPMTNVKVQELNSGNSTVTDNNGFFSFKAESLVIDHKLSMDGATTQVHFTYKRNKETNDDKSFLVLVKAEESGKIIKVLSSSIAMEWDGSLKQAISRAKDYAAQPEVKTNAETLTNGNVRVEAKGGVMGWYGRKAGDDMYVTADTITVKLDDPKGWIIYGDNMYTAREYKERFTGEHVKKVYFFSKENGQRIWGDKAKDGVLMINENPAYQQYTDSWQTEKNDTVPPKRRPASSKYPDTLSWVENGRVEHDDFLKRHPEVRSISWSNSTEKSEHKENGKEISQSNNSESHIKLTLKDGSAEKYDLDSDKDMQRFKAKYGELPVQAPPPPMPPAVPATPVKKSFSPPASPSAPPPSRKDLKTIEPPTPPTPPATKNISLSPVKTETIALTNVKTELEEVKILNVRPVVEEVTVVNLKTSPKTELQEVKIVSQKPVLEEVKITPLKTDVKLETREKITLKEVKVEKVKSKE